MLLVAGVMVALAQFGAPGTAWARHRGPTTTTSIARTTTSTARTTTTIAATTTTTVAQTTTMTTVPPTTTTTVPGGGPTTGGYDISWPQCSAAFPAHPAFGIVGASDGLAFSDNPCLASEYRWAAGASRPAALYLNTADPGSASTHWNAPGPKACSGSSDDVGCAFNYGWNAAGHAFAYAGTQGASPSAPWWLDVETANTWSTNTAANDADIQGMVDYFGSRAVTVGVYSTAFQWGQITGGVSLTVPNWLAGATSGSQASGWCSSAQSSTGGPVRVVQYPSGSFDGDVSC
ncbi:MAG: hypothetical protein ACRDZ8_17455 [Acidimicrobiales bacterium]